MCQKGNPVRITKFEAVGDFLAILWSDDVETVIPLEKLRRACPCAECRGEVDVTGRLHKVGDAKPYFSTSFEVRNWDWVGNYAVQMRWVDGHETGLFTFDQLRALGDEAGH
jgi:DUF971 family protein